MKHREILFIIDDCDAAFQKFWADLNPFFKMVDDETTAMKFIFLFKELPSYKFSVGFKEVKIGQISIDDATSMLYNQCQEKLTPAQSWDYLRREVFV